MGQRSPAAMSALAICRQRSVREPSGSPSEMRSPSVCRTTPGRTISVAKYTMEPTTRRGSTAAEITPPGSTRSSRVPASGPPPDWKNHHGTPFCVLTTIVSGPSVGASCGARAGRPWALTARTTTSAGPPSSRLATTRGRASKLPSTLSTCTPCSCMARRCGPRANRVTSCPARAMRAPRYAPIAPAPAIRNFIAPHP